jgi:hypothetical protein
MERIDLVHSSILNPHGKNKKKLKKKEKIKTSFTRLINSAEKGEEATFYGSNEDIVDGSIEELLDEVHSIGEELKEKPNLGNISNYKKAVRSFMNYILKSTMGVEEKISGRNILKRKKFTLVKVIDQKLERLAASVLQNQKEQLDILKKVDEINGLLVDLLS